jgi:predicted nuclease of predicted toxin-antitoxin system
MIIWIDAQLSPAIAKWITTEIGVETHALRDLGLRDSTDHEIFSAAKSAGCIVMTKDSDFVKLLGQYGPPPKIIWLTCGNTSNERLKQILTATLEKALELFDSGENLVEIRDTR